MRRERLLLGIFLVAGSPGVGERFTVAAQEVVPKELALALIRTAPQGGDILVGAAPADLADDLPTPPGARILGSFVSTGYAQVAIAFPGRTDSAIAFVRSALVRRGWVAWQQPIDESGGLRMQMATMSMPTTLCRTGGSRPDGITITGAFYGYNTTLLRVTRTVMSMCDPSTRTTAMQSREMRPPFHGVPPLYAPGGPGNAFATCRPSPTGMRGRATQNQPVLSPLSATEIVAYYGRQLDSAGWRSTRTPETSRAAGQWTKTDSVGTREVTITVSGVPNRGECYNVELSLAYE
jgi:hypothetical protein